MADDPRFADIGGIVLDAVGTLIDPRPSVAVAYAGAASRQGIDLDPAVIRRRFRTSFGTDEIDEARGPLFTDEPTERRRWQRIVRDCLPELPDPGRAFAELWDHFGDPASWITFPDVEPALLAFQQAGLRIAIASNFDGRLRNVLNGLSAFASLDVPIVISSEVGRRKPHPDFYRAASDRLNLPPEKVLCAGDDLENDRNGPIRAGLRAVLIDRDRRADPDLQALPDLHELAKRLSSA